MGFSDQVAYGAAQVFANSLQAAITNALSGPSPAQRARWEAERRTREAAERREREEKRRRFQDERRLLLEGMKTPGGAGGELRLRGMDPADGGDLAFKDPDPARPALSVEADCRKRSAEAYHERETDRRESIARLDALLKHHPPAPVKKEIDRCKLTAPLPPHLTCIEGMDAERLKMLDEYWARKNAWDLKCRLSYDPPAVGPPQAPQATHSTQACENGCGTTREASSRNCDREHPKRDVDWGNCLNAAIRLWQGCKDSCTAAAQYQKGERE